MRSLPAASPILILILIVLSPRQAMADSGMELPWRTAGLTERQAAAHLLDRLTYGPRPGEVEQVVDEGLEAWVERQLDGGAPDLDLDRRLAGIESLDLAVREFPEVYPNPGLVLRRAQEAGVVAEGQDPRQIEDERERRRMRREIVRWAEQEGIRFQRELVGELMGQKLLRALYA